MWSDRCAYGFHAFACLAWAVPCPCMSCWAMPSRALPCAMPCPFHALAHVPCMRAMVPCMRAMVPCSTHEQRPWCLPAHGASAHEQRPWCQRSAHEQRPWCQRPWCLPASSAHEQRPCLTIFFLPRFVQRLSIVWPSGNPTIITYMCHARIHSECESLGT